MTTAPPAAAAAGADPSNASSSPLYRPGAVRDFFKIPAPLKRLFDQFPRRVYPANELALRTTQLLESGEESQSRETETHNLFVWTDGASEDGRLASFNPKCLMWQVHLLSRNVALRTVPSNNHASPSGTLPFLLPNSSAPPVPSFADQAIVAQDTLKKWVHEQDKGVLDKNDKMRLELHMSAIEGPIRRAWLFHMYLTPNFDLITVPCYINTQTSNSIVRLAMTHELRRAAETELLKHTSKICEENTYQDAREILGAFDRLLRSSKTGLVLDTEEPNILDAALFAYTFPLLGISTESWASAELPFLVSGCSAIVAHHDLMLSKYLGGELRVPRQYLRVAR